MNDGSWTLYMRCQRAGMEALERSNSYIGKYAVTHEQIGFSQQSRSVLQLMRLEIVDHSQGYYPDYEN